MSEERLKEIKQSLDFQEIMLISERETYGVGLEGVDELLKEEKDLYNEVIRLQQENKKLKENKKKAIEYVSKLSSKGRDCEIYYDIKKEILNLLGDKNE